MGSGRLAKTTVSSEVALAAAQTVLPFPPVAASLGFVPSSWGTVAAGTIPEFDLEIRAAAAVTLTVAVIYAGRQHTFVIADDDIDVVDFANNELDVGAHGYLHGDGPLRLTTSGTLPTGLALATDYWVIYTNSGTIQLAISLENALTGTAVTFSDIGSGTHTIADTASTKRVHWHAFSTLGTIVLGVQKAYSIRLNHNPLVVAYSLFATLGDTIATSVGMIPIQTR